MLQLAGRTTATDPTLTYQTAVLEHLPSNVMATDLDLNLVFINRQARATLQTLDPEIRRMFRIGSDELLGGSIHRMHKDPARVEAILRDPRSFPHHAKLRFGEVVLRAVFNQVVDADGVLVGFVAVWESVAEREGQAMAATDGLFEVAATMSSAASDLRTTAAESEAEAATIAGAAEELSSSIAEISRNVTRAASTASAASQAMTVMETTAAELGASSDEIGGLVSLIDSIAKQTNLLALNATIEAARAGDAGKGFAVVANEVKELAQQTAGATGEIRSKVESIQANVASVSGAIGEVTGVVSEISELQTGIAAAVEEQAVTASEMARGVAAVADATRGVAAVSDTISRTASTVEGRTEELRGLLDD